MWCELFFCSPEHSRWARVKESTSSRFFFSWLNRSRVVHTNSRGVSERRSRRAMKFQPLIGRDKCNIELSSRKNIAAYPSLSITEKIVLLISCESLLRRWRANGSRWCCCYKVFVHNALGGERLTSSFYSAIKLGRLNSFAVFRSHFESTTREERKIQYSADDMERKLLLRNSIGKTTMSTEDMRTRRLMKFDALINNIFVAFWCCCCCARPERNGHFFTCVNRAHLRYW